MSNLYEVYVGDNLIYSQLDGGHDLVFTVHDDWKDKDIVLNINGIKKTVRSDAEGYVRLSVGMLVDASNMFFEYGYRPALKELIQTPDLKFCKNMRYMLGNHAGISNVGNHEYTVNSEDIENWNVSNCEDFSYIFSGDYGLKNDTLDLSKWRPYRAKTLQSFIQFNNRLKELNLNGWQFHNDNVNTSHFVQTPPIEYIHLKGWDFSKVTDVPFFTSTLKYVEGPFRGINRSFVLHPSASMNIQNIRTILNGLEKVSSAHTITTNETTYNKLEDTDIAFVTSLGWTLYY